MAANIFKGTTNSNWNTSTNWSLGAVPTNSDSNVATFDATSPNCTQNLLNAPCNGIDFTGYTATLTMTNSIIVYGNITWISTISSRISGASIMSMANTGTLTSNGGTWPNSFGMLGGATCTMADNAIIGNTIAATGNFTLNGAFTMSVSSGITVSTGVTLSGTATIIMTGTGTITITGSGVLKNNLTINSSGTVTIGSINYNTGTLTYTAGTMSISGTLTVALSTTFATSGMTWTNITISAAATLTLNSLLTVTGTLTDSQTSTFAGTAGFTCATFTSIGVGKTITLTTGNTYTITTAITVTGTAASPNIIASSSGSVQAILILNYGATQDIDYCSATRIDSSAGQPIYTFKGILTTATNWRLLTAPPTVGNTFAS